MCVTQVFPLEPEASLSLSHPHLLLYSFVLLSLLMSLLTEKLCPLFLSFFSALSLYQLLFPHGIVYDFLGFTFKSFITCVPATLTFLLL